MLNLDLRLRILKKYPTQSDFAEAVQMSDSKVSRVLRGRGQLSETEAKKWARLLGCGMEELTPVITMEKEPKSKKG